MNVKFITKTGDATIDGKTYGPEELLVYIARVSNPSNQSNTDTSAKLINYMLKNKHVSPFEMIDFTVEIKTSRAIAQQVLRHWSLNVQEFSQRYAEVIDMEPVQLRKAGSTNRQSSTEVFDPKLAYGFQEDLHGRRIYCKASEAIDEHILESQLLYKALLEAGVAKECARMVLPLTTQTTMYLKGTLRDWIFYLQQRLDPHAQLEHRQLAEEIRSIFKLHFPNVYEAITEMLNPENTL